MKNIVHPSAEYMLHQAFVVDYQYLALDMCCCCSFKLSKASTSYLIDIVSCFLAYFLIVCFVSGVFFGGWGTSRAFYAVLRTLGP